MGNDIDSIETHVLLFQEQLPNGYAEVDERQRYEDHLTGSDVIFESPFQNLVVVELYFFSGLKNIRHSHQHLVLLLGQSCQLRHDRLGEV